MTCCPSSMSRLSWASLPSSPEVSFHSAGLSARVIGDLQTCDEVMSTNWADYLNLVYSVPFWEAMS